MLLRSRIFGMDWNRFAKKVNFHSGNRKRDKRRKMVPFDAFIDPLIDPKEIKHIKSVIKSGQSFKNST